MEYYNKYVKYKRKYLHLKYFVSNNNSNNFNSSHLIYPDLLGGKIDPTLLNDMLSIKDIDIPEKYLADSIIVKIRDTDPITLEEFYDTTNKFNANNAIINITADDLHKGIFDVSTNDNERYILKAIPVLTFDITHKVICWSWINSLLLGIPYYKDVITIFKNDMEKYIKSIDHFNFDCIKYGNDDQKLKYLIDDITIVAKHVLNAQGYIEITTEEPDGTEIKEMLFIVKIKKIDDK